MYYHKKRLGCQYASIRASYPAQNASYRFADCGFLQQNGYESISTCCLSHRLYIADLIVGGENEEATNQERGNVNLTTTDAIRLVLDKAATVDEALELLKNHDMHSVIGQCSF